MADGKDSDTGVGCQRSITEIAVTLLLQQPELSNSVLPVPSPDDSTEKFPSLDSSSPKEVKEITQEIPSRTSSKKVECFFTQVNQQMSVSIGEEKVRVCDSAPGSFVSPEKIEDCGRKIGNSGDQLLETKDSSLDFVSGNEQKNLVLKSYKGKEIVCDTKEEFDGRQVLAAPKSTEVYKGSNITEKKGFSRTDKREAKNVLEAKKKQSLAKVDAAGILGNLKGIDESVRRSLKVEVIDDTALIATVPVPKKGNRFVKAAGKNVKKNEKQEAGLKKAKKSQRKGKNGRKDLETCGKLKKTPNAGKCSNGMIRIGEVDNGGQKNGFKARKYSMKEMEAMRCVNIIEQKKLWRGVYAGLGDVVRREYKDLACSSSQKNPQLQCDLSQLIGRRGKENASGILNGVVAARGRLNHVNIYVR